MQAPTPRPIQPGFTTWRPQNPSNMAPARPTNAPKAAVAGPYAPRGPLQWLGVAWAVLVWSLCRHFGYCHLNAPPGRGWGPKRRKSLWHPPEKEGTRAV